MVETHRQSLNAFCITSRSESRERAGKYRHVVDAMRTVCWYHELRLRTHAATAYQLEKMVEPDSFTIDADGAVQKRNKWRRYRLGEITPGEATISRLEAMFRGSGDVFHHALWDAVRPPIFSASGARQSRLGLRVGAIAAKSPVRAWTRRDGVLRRVERMGDWNALAWLVALLCECIADDDGEAVIEVSRSLARTMTIATTSLVDHGIAGPLADYLKEMFSAHHELAGIYLPASEDCLVRGRRADHIIQTLEYQQDRAFGAQERTDHLLEVMRAKYGIDAMHCLLPFPFPVSDHCP